MGETGVADKRDVITVSLATLALSAPARQAGPPGPPDGAPIKLRAVTFTPALGERPEIPPGLEIAEYAQGVRGYYIVQFTGPVEPAWRAAAEAAGAELLGYLPDFAFKARLTPAAARSSSRRIPPARGCTQTQGAAAFPAPTRWMQRAPTTSSGKTRR